ncbi:MAG: carboxyl transferase domain-containing protein [Lachnospiraceae bacterium]|nr:carboxyl transferase domain-containing protein [Lachnospiraceae bacterium]
MSKTTLSARERIEHLLDGASFVEIGGQMTSRSTDFNLNPQETPGDGVITGYGVIDGNLVYVYSQDAKVLGGSIGEMHARKIAHIYDLAVKVGAPVIGLIDCAGLRLQEAADALNSFGVLFSKQACASGIIPQLTGIFGTCGGGSALIPTLTDFTVMEKESGRLFVNSPNTLDGNEISRLDTANASYQETNNSQIDIAVSGEEEVIANLRQLITVLPACYDDDASYEECNDDLNRIIPELENAGADSRSIFSLISDDNFFLELKKEYAKEMITGFARLNGVTVGCVGNQAAESSVLTTKGANKAAEFVRFCDAFQIPVLVVSNVDGFKATVHEEKTIAKAAAKLTYAFASATVPKVTLMTGDAFGTAYIAMNSKSIGADIVYAWPQARVGMMDPEQAVRIMYADEISSAENKTELIAQKTAEYNELQSSGMSAARRGYIDDIIEPDATRKRLIAAFEMLFTKREDRPAKKHGTV